MSTQAEHRIDTADLEKRHFLTTRQAARLLGHGKDFWAHHFDAGEINGYVLMGGRHLEREDCVRFLLGQARVVQFPGAHGKGGVNHKAHLRLQALRRKHGGIQLSLEMEETGTG